MECDLLLFVCGVLLTYAAAAAGAYVQADYKEQGINVDNIEFSDNAYVSCVSVCLCVPCLCVCLFVCIC